MESKDPGEGIARLNSSIERLLKDSSGREQLERDWVGAVSDRVGFNPEQIAFIRALPPKSVKTIQDIVHSVEETNGRIYFKLDGRGDAELFADHSPISEGPVEPLRLVSLMAKVEMIAIRLRDSWKKRYRLSRGASGNGCRVTRVLRTALFLALLLPFQLLAQSTYSVSVSNIYVQHTRAHTNDTIYVSMMGTNTFALPPEKKSCTGSAPSGQAWCVNQKIGDMQDGGHPLNANDLPTIGPFEVDQGGTLLFAIAVWNYGFGIKSGTGDLKSALYKAVQPVVTTNFGYNSLGQINTNLVPSLNHHSWPGCDGPVVGWSIRIKADALARMIAQGATGEWSVGPFTVRSQVGCGASSKYTVTYRLIQNSGR